MKKQRIRAFVLAGVYLLFLLLMDYPYLSRLYNDCISGEIVASFGKREENADFGRRLSLARAFNRYLAGEGSCPEELRAEGSERGVSPGREETLAPDGEEGDSPDWEETLAPDGEEDASTEQRTAPPAGGGELSEAGKHGWMQAARVLCTEDSLLAGWVRIPHLNLTLPLFIGTEDEVLDRGAGILEERSLPVGGAGTHACISAHRGLPDRTLFTNLDMLEDGDRIDVHTLGQTVSYEVFGHETVKPSDTEALGILPGQDLLTLITCTPYGINTHRLYVHARRCAPEAGGEEPVTEIRDFLSLLRDPVFWKLWWWIPATVMLLLFLALMLRRSMIARL